MSLPLSFVCSIDDIVVAIYDFLIVIVIAVYDFLIVWKLEVEVLNL
jgi:hypothetical protein